MKKVLTLVIVGLLIVVLAVIVWQAKTGEKYNLIAANYSDGEIKIQIKAGQRILPAFQVEAGGSVVGYLPGLVTQKIKLPSGTFELAVAEQPDGKHAVIEIDPLKGYFIYIITKPNRELNVYQSNKEQKYDSKAGLQ